MNETDNMSTDNIPADWVLLEAARRCNWLYNNDQPDGGIEELQSDYRKSEYSSGYSNYSNRAYRALCDMIAKHEQPPVDPDVEAVKRNTSSDPLATPREFAFPGMTLRDWFAGQALSIVYCRFVNGSDPTPDDLSLQAYAIADAMLQERGQ